MYVPSTVPTTSKDNTMQEAMQRFTTEELSKAWEGLMSTAHEASDRGDADRALALRERATIVRTEINARKARTMPR